MLRFLIQNRPQIIGRKYEAFWIDAVCCSAQICENLTKHSASRRHSFCRAPSDGSLGMKCFNAGLLDQIPLTRQTDLHHKSKNNVCVSVNLKGIVHQKCHHLFTNVPVQSRLILVSTQQSMAYIFMRIHKVN